MNEELRIALENFLNTFRDSEPVTRYLNAKEMYMSDQITIWQRLL